MVMYFVHDIRFFGKNGSAMHAVSIECSAICRAVMNRTTRIFQFSAILSAWTSVCQITQFEALRVMFSAMHMDGVLVCWWSHLPENNFFESSSAFWKWGSKRKFDTEWLHAIHVCWDTLHVLLLFMNKLKRDEIKAVSSPAVKLESTNVTEPISTTIVLRLRNVYVKMSRFFLRVKHVLLHIL